MNISPAQTSVASATVKVALVSAAVMIFRFSYRFFLTTKERSYETLIANYAASVAAGATSSAVVKVPNSVFATIISIIIVNVASSGTA